MQKPKKKERALYISVNRKPETGMIRKLDMEDTKWFQIKHPQFIRLKRLRKKPVATPRGKVIR